VVLEGLVQYIISKTSCNGLFSVEIWNIYKAVIQGKKIKIK